MKQEQNEPKELPVGFGMALSMRPDALLAFSQMPKAKRNDIIKKASQVQSKPEMESLTDSLTSDGQPPEHT